MSDEDEEETKGRRLTPAEWVKLKSHWEFGTHTLEQLSQMFGIRRDTIHRRLKRDGVEKGSRAHEAAEANSQANFDEVAQQAAEDARRIFETKNEHYKYAEALAKLTMQEVLRAKQNGAAFVTIDGNVTALNKTAKTLAILRQERFAILGLDKEDGDPGELDELLISELSAEQIADIQATVRGMTPPSEGDDLGDLDDFDDFSGGLGDEIIEEIEDDED